MSTYKLVSKIVETTPAWVECGCDNGSVLTVHTDYYGEQIEEPCGLCQGEGGKWHEAVGKYNVGLTGRADGTMVNGTYVTKSTTLIREWEVCKMCEGYPNKTTAMDITQGYRPYCNRCQGTGAEPDTAGEWRVG